MTFELPPKDRFDLPEVLELVKSFGCRREDLFEYLCKGKLQALAYPYRLERQREVFIEPDEWQEWFREPWEFAVYDGWIGDKDIAEHATTIPLHIVPRVARADCDRVLKDGGRAASTATVFVSRDELNRFINWLKNPSKSRPGPRRPGAGRPQKHDYTEIDQLLEKRFEEKGVAGFERPSEVTAYLKEQIGNEPLPPDSTLRNHINTWREKLTANR